MKKILVIFNCITMLTYCANDKDKDDKDKAKDPTNQTEDQTQEKAKNPNSPTNNPTTFGLPSWIMGTWLDSNGVTLQRCTFFQQTILCERLQVLRRDFAWIPCHLQ